MITSESNNRMIAPCGINCSLCLAFLRDKNKCCGCWGADSNKPYHCSACSIKNCDNLAATGSKFCYECSNYPCTRLKQLDKRYRLKYKVDILDNMATIKESGLSAFMNAETIKWKCPQCGGSICMHRGYCLHCQN